MTFFYQGGNVAFFANLIVDWKQFGVSVTVMSSPYSKQTRFITGFT